MGDVGERDRWLIDGDCTKCRRDKFCSKPCKLHKQRTQAELTSMVGSMMLKSMLRGMSGGESYSDDDGFPG